MFNVYQSINLEDEICGEYAYVTQLAARSDVVVGERMHLCKHIFHHCLPHPRGNTNLGQVGSVGTWCPRRGLDVLYVRSLSMTCFAVFFGFQSKLKKDIHIIAKFSVSFFLTLCQHFWLNKSIIYFEYCQWESN